VAAVLVFAIGSAALASAPLNNVAQQVASMNADALSDLVLLLVCATVALA
jgi:hypothetical protein